MYVIRDDFSYEIVKGTDTLLLDFDDRVISLPVDVDFNDFLSTFMAMNLSREDIESLWNSFLRSDNRYRFSVNHNGYSVFFLYTSTYEIYVKDLTNGDVWSRIRLYSFFDTFRILSKEGLLTSSLSDDDYIALVRDYVYDLKAYSDEVESLNETFASLSKRTKVTLTSYSRGYLVERDNQVRFIPGSDLIKEEVYPYLALLGVYLDSSTDSEEYKSDFLTELNFSGIDTSSTFEIGADSYSAKSGKLLTLEFWDRPTSKLDAKLEIFVDDASEHLVTRKEGKLDGSLFQSLEKLIATIF